MQITNIKPRYHDGIRLAPGNYTVKVMRSGYKTKKGNVRLENDLNINVVLQKESEGVIKTKNTARPDGNGRWDWTVFIDTDPKTLSTIRHVEYTLHSTFPNPVRKVSDPSHKFALSSNGWGTFEIKIKVVFKDGRTKRLRHMLKFN